MYEIIYLKVKKVYMNIRKILVNLYLVKKETIFFLVLVARISLFNLI